MSKKNLLVIAGLLILCGIAVRFFPHTPNMTPVTAFAYIGSLYLGRKWAVMIPLLVLFLSDLLIGFSDWKITLSVYGSFVVISLLSFVATKRRAIFPVGLSVIGASFVFFFITNAAVWAFSPWYEKNISGLLYSYELGLPFLRNMLLGDILYTAALVGLFEAGLLLHRRRFIFQKVLCTFAFSPSPYNKLH